MNFAFDDFLWFFKTIYFTNLPVLKNLKVGISTAFYAILRKNNNFLFRPIVSSFSVSIMGEQLSSHVLSG
jgi:hypothetical protein